MKISVITITFNSKAYLDETIRSVISQDYPDFEYILVDGGSTDGTLDTIREYAARDPRIRFISEPDRGIADAMNKGVALASGDVVAHLHSDDRYPDSSVLFTVARAFAGNPAALWVTGGIRIIDEAGAVRREIPARNYSYGKLVRSNFILHAATFIRRDAFLRAGGFDLSRKYAMDYDLWLRLGALGAPAVVDSILACFRFHQGSLSTVQTERAFEEELAIRKAFLRGKPLQFFFHYLYYLAKKSRNKRFAQRLLSS